MISKQTLQWKKKKKNLIKFDCLKESRCVFIEELALPGVSLFVMGSI